MPTISPARSEAARLNGAKSRGPKTEEGKAKSSQNALKHGLCAAKEVVAPGDPEGFEEFQAGLHAHFKPRNAWETVLVERIVACSWRLRRAAALEAHLLGGDRPGTLDYKFHDTFGHKEQRFLTLNRYEATLLRNLREATRDLKEAKAQKDETNPRDVEAQTEELRNEPNDASPPPPEVSLLPEAKEGLHAEALAKESPSAEALAKEGSRAEALAKAWEVDSGPSAVRTELPNEPKEPEPERPAPAPIRVLPPSASVYWDR